MRCRDDEDLALDRIDAERTRPSPPEPAHAAAAEPPSPARPSLSYRPNSRSFASASAATPSTSPTSCTPPAAPRPRRSASLTKRAHASPSSSNPPAVCCAGVAADSAERALERQRLKLAEEEIAAAAERERNLASSVPDRAAWEAERRVLRERAAELNAQLSTRRREHLRVALERPAPYLTEALGALPASRALAAPGSKPPRASRPTASTTPSPTPATHSDRAERPARARALATRPPRPPTRSARPRPPQRPPALPRDLEPVPSLLSFVQLATALVRG